MAHIITYLTFAGNCREAMKFYCSCLGGALEFQTVSESPLAGSMPQEMRDCVLHSTLTCGPLLIMGSDMVGEHGLIRGNAVSLMLDCDTETELRDCFARLADGGTVTHELEVTFWGALFGDLTDRYGNQWLLHFDRAKNDPVS
jgi:PhnB protein